MTDYQNELVMEHLDLVNWVIRTRISVPNRPLLTYDDFYAIGCEAICRAALKYQADSGEFAPFACRYIYNAIIDHCRAMNYRLQRSVDAGFEEGEVLFDLLAHTTVDFEAEVTDDSAMAALRACKEKYQGVARKGVEAIELKLQGYTCHPFYCDEVPCYLTDECDNKHCPLRRHDVEDKEKADEEKSRF